MLNLGNGEHSAARIFHHVTKLLKLFEELSGLQQCDLGPDPDPNPEQYWAEYGISAEDFLIELAKDLGYNIKKLKFENKGK